jgi:hypothetical protein
MSDGRCPWRRRTCQGIFCKQTFREKNMLENKPNFPNVSTRRCSLCGSVKPLTADNFQSAPSFAKGFSYYCNDCDIESRKQKSFVSEKSKADIVVEVHHVKLPVALTARQASLDKDMIFRH